MTYIRYELKFPIGSGITAWDLAEKGEISWVDFGVYASFHRNSAWGYAGKVNRKSWKQWAEILNISRNSAVAHVDNLINIGLLYKYPNTKGQKPQFVIFKESLTEKQIKHYLNIFEVNPNFTYIQEKSHPAETTEPVAEPEKAYNTGIFMFDGDEYHCDGYIFRKKEHDKLRILIHPPEPVVEHFTETLIEDDCEVSA